MKSKRILALVLIGLMLIVIGCNDEGITFATNQVGEVVGWIGQIKQNYCGAACIAMFDLYYGLGGPIDQDSIMSVTDTNNSGRLSFGEMLIHLNKYGPPDFYFTEDIT